MNHQERVFHVASRHFVRRVHTWGDADKLADHCLNCAETFVKAFEKKYPTTPWQPGDWREELKVLKEEAEYRAKQESWPPYEVMPKDEGY